MKELTIFYNSGLGNLMFQYALQLSLESKGYNVKAIGNASALSKAFKNIQLDFSSYNTKYDNIFNEPYDSSSTFIPSLFEIDKPSCLLKGYFQTEKYFIDIKEKIIEQYKFNIDDKALEMGNFIKNNEKPVVGIHIRRGDYLYSPPHKNICSDKYYDNAILTIQQKLGTSDINFVIFSDDMKWCKEKYPDYLCIDKNEFDTYEDYYDMYWMSCCHHNIIANSTFSWWSAYLNNNPDKIIITPNKWLNISDTPDIWCNDWIKVEV